MHHRFVVGLSSFIQFVVGLVNCCVGRFGRSFGWSFQSVIWPFGIFGRLVGLAHQSDWLLC